MLLKIKEIGLLVISAFLIVGITSACSQEGGDKNVRPKVSYEEIQAEFKESIGKLEFPSEVSKPDRMEGEEKGAVYQKGYGDTRASFLYECAWEREFLKTYSSDKNRAKKALEVLEKIPDMPYMKPPRADRTVPETFKEYLAKAKLGDPSGFQNTVEVNCPN